MGPRAYTQLHFAAQRGDLDAVVELLARGKNPNHFDEGGCTPLHYAAEDGHIEVVKSLLAAGANVNAHDEGVIGNTAIAHIAGNCSLEMAQLLVNAGADPTITGWMQLTALHRSEKRKRGDGPKVHQLLCDAARRLAKRS
jgi:ankyrin repeat protein